MKKGYANLEEKVNVEEFSLVYFSFDFKMTPENLTHRQLVLYGDFLSEPVRLFIAFPPTPFLPLICSQLFWITVPFVLYGEPYILAEVL